jgi:putative phosphoribosyl transferase
MRADDVRIPVGPVELAGRLTVPDDPVGLVLFAHGSGSSRLSPRNRFVASELNEAGLGTLLFDLLTEDEEPNRARVFDIPLLGQRLVEVTGWARDDMGFHGIPVGYFGASTGAGAALVAASSPSAEIAAIVSRGGRPDLAGDHLPEVVAPTLLIVGSHDAVVEDLNRLAMSQMVCECRLEIVSGATHLFEEPGTLEQVAILARDWFASHL